MSETPQKKMLRLMEVIHLLHRQPCSMAYLVNATGKHKRTIYRYLNLLENLGIVVNGKGKGKMWIERCPICG